jgi:hypothetical protein
MGTTLARGAECCCDIVGTAARLGKHDHVFVLADLAQFELLLESMKKIDGL